MTPAASARLSAIAPLVIALLSAGCGSTEPRAASGGAGGSAPAPVLEPSIFDCSKASEPARTSSVPVTCATDRACSTKLVSGHRGVGGDLGVIAPENTLASVFAAVALGVDFIETDPRATKDGALVNMHDTSVDRTTSGEGEVSDMLLADIQALAIDAGDLPGDFSCERVPTIEEVLTAAKGKIHVLLDANKTDRVDLIVEAVQKTGTLEWAIFDTGSVEKIDEALAIEPALHTMIRVADEAALGSELAHFAAHPPVIVEIHDGGTPQKLAAAIHAAGHRALYDTFVTDVAAALDDDPSHYAPLFDAGMDIAQTDRPDLVLRHLAR